MKRDWRRFAPIGIYIAIIALFVSLGLYIVQRQLSLALQISISIVVLGLAAFAIMDPQRIRRFLTGRQARYGSNALILLLAFLGVLVVINYLVYQNTKRWDLTEDKENTLAPETVDVLERLPDTVYAQAFFSNRLSNENAESLLDQYSYEGGDNFIYEFIDPEQDPITAQNANITRDGTIVLTLDTFQEQVELVSEEEITSALIRLLNPEMKNIYFLTGHGEYSPEDTGDESYAFLNNRLEAKNYNVQLLNLLAMNEIPGDTDLIIIAGPTRPISEEEVEYLTEYMDSGGALIVMQEPLPLTEFGETNDPLIDLLDSWGISLGEGVIVDFSSNQPLIAVSNQYGNHIITQKMRGLASIYPTARGIVTSDEISSGVSQVDLVLTSNQSWSETDFTSLESGNANPDPDVDLMGPITIATVAENFESNARLVVFGDSDFASNAYVEAYGNLDIMINSIDWAVGEEDLIDLTPRQQTQRVLLPPQQYSTGLILLVSMIIIPGIVVVSGVGVWFMRRRRG